MEGSDTPYKLLSSDADTSPSHQDKSPFPMQGLAIAD